MKIGTTVAACGAALGLLPGAALAHDGHFNHHHRFGALLKGAVVSTDTSDNTLVVHVTKARGAASSLVGDDVTVKAVKGWVADTNNDGAHNLANVKDGDTVFVFAKRRFTDGTNVSAAFVVYKAGRGDQQAARTSDGDRTTWRCDH